MIIKPQPKASSAKTHLVISLIKSVVRLIGCGFLINGDFIVSGALLGVAELLGIAEEIF